MTAGAIGQAVEQGDHVTPDQFKAGRMVGTVVTTATLTVGILRLLG